MRIYNATIHPHKNAIKHKHKHTTNLIENHTNTKITVTKNSFASQPDKFYLTYIYMFICVTANKKINTDTTQIATRNFTIQHHHHHIQIKHHPHKQIQINKISSHTAHRFIIFDTPRTHT